MTIITDSPLCADLGRAISKDELNELPVEVIPVPVEVVDESTPLSRVQDICEDLKRAIVVGFDTETKPSFTKGVTHRVSLLQLSCQDRVYIFRLLRMSPEAVTSVRAIVEDKGVVKVGVGVHDDARILKSDHEWTPSGMLELRRMTVEKAIQVGSLSKIYALLYGKRLTKGQRLSDWERDSLTEAQINYAGLDAWAGLQIFRTLEEVFSPSMLENKFEPIKKITPTTARTHRKRVKGRKAPKTPAK